MRDTPPLKPALLFLPPDFFPPSFSPISLPSHPPSLSGPAVNPAPPTPRSRPSCFLAHPALRQCTKGTPFLHAFSGGKHSKKGPSRGETVKPSDGRGPGCHTWGEKQQTRRRPGVALQRPMPIQPQQGHRRHPSRRSLCHTACIIALLLPLPPWLKLSLVFMSPPLLPQRRPYTPTHPLASTSRPKSLCLTAGLA